MKYVIIDLEMNGIPRHLPESAICAKETIEIGAVMLDEHLQEISSYRTYIKPEYNNGIQKSITKLTGITNEMVSNAPTFNEALKMFLKWCLGPKDKVNIYAWSDSDYNQIRSELLLKRCDLDIHERALVENEWIDFQKEFDLNMGFERRVSLKTALDLAGIDFSGRQHDALDDAKNTAELFQIFKNEVLFNRVLGKISEVMKPSTFGNTLGSMIDFSAFAIA